MPTCGPRFQGDEIWARKTKSYLTAEPATVPKQPKADVIALIGYFRLWTQMRSAGMSALAPLLEY